MVPNAGIAGFSNPADSSIEHLAQMVQEPIAHQLLIRQNQVRRFLIHDSQFRADLGFEFSDPPGVSVAESCEAVFQSDVVDLPSDRAELQVFHAQQAVDIFGKRAEAVGEFFPEFGQLIEAADVREFSIGLDLVPARRDVGFGKKTP